MPKKYSTSKKERPKGDTISYEDIKRKKKKKPKKKKKGVVDTLKEYLEGWG